MTWQDNDDYLASGHGRPRRQASNRYYADLPIRIAERAIRQREAEERTVQIRAWLSRREKR